VNSQSEIKASKNLVELNNFKFKADSPI